MKRCAITDGTALTRADWLVARCTELAADGVELLIVREKAMAAGELVDFVRRVVAVAGGMQVLVAARADVALASGAAGVHLSARVGELTPAQVRRVMPGALVTVSCHELWEVARARQHGADAVLFGPVFGKWVQGAEVVAGCGVEQLAQAVRAAGEVPVFALGSVDAANVELCRQAAGIAGIRSYFGSAVIA